MSGYTPTQCHQCRGVVTSTDSTGYTKSRARLIIEHGYCSCATPATQSMSATQATPIPQPMQAAPVRPMTAAPEVEQNVAYSGPSVRA
jgi:hypothetical protein